MLKAAVEAYRMFMKQCQRFAVRDLIIVILGSMGFSSKVPTIRFTRLDVQHILLTGTVQTFQDPLRTHLVF
jgi:hypothetical protein